MWKYLLIIFLCLTMISGCDNSYYKGPITDHFDGVKFHNHQKGHSHTFLNFLKWVINRNPMEWPDNIKVKKITALPDRINDDKIYATYINHATVLIQTNNLNIITDPIWSERASPFSWMGPKRVYHPPIDIEKLPKIDIILISHNHYDHLDLPTLKKIYKIHKPKIYAGLGVDKFLRNYGFEFSYGLDWWQSKQINNNVSISFVPAQHWSRRGLFDKNKTLWGGFIINSDNKQIYFAGDTGYNKKHFLDIKKAFSNIKLSLLPIGSYEPRWFMKHAHLNPEEAVLAATDLNSQYNIGIHFDTFFRIADDVYNKAVEDLQLALTKYKKQQSWFQTLLPGKTIVIS